MTNRILLFTAFLCYSVAASSQCQLTTVYFDYAKYDLKKSERPKLDSIVKALSNGTYLVELSGHTDSVNTDAFNMKLSEQRNKAVEDYLTKKSKGKIQVTMKKFPHGETKPIVPNDTKENMAKNRRVEIYLLAFQDDKFVFHGAGTESVAIPAEFPGACSICESVKYSFLHNDKEAKDAGLTMKSASGRDLTTAGMAQFSFDCPEKMATCLPLTITLPTASNLRFECLSAGTLRRSGNLETSSATFQVNPSTKTITSTDGCYKMGTWTVFAKPVEDLCQHSITFPADLTILKTKKYSGDSTSYIEGSQMPLKLKCGSSHSLFGWATADGKNYYLKGSLRSFITKAESKGNCDSLFTYELTKEKYVVVPTSDTTVFVKFKGFASVKNPGYYIDELELLLPLTFVKKTTYSANYLNYDHHLRVEDDKVYNFKYTDVKTKYKKGKKKLKVTVKKSKLAVQ